MLRRVGLLVGAVCLTYAGVLAAAFMGWGTSLGPSSLLPSDSADGGHGPGGTRPQGGIGRRPDLPHGTPSPRRSATTPAP
ncbi:hypothetical protein GCM10010339_74520 [Streptomyces alanosinicus]|uniref:Uncharacterized protein n=1 Tax=Streptomyces alanosinicus TaxID=68171 RepID=A0A919D6J2_9ACTN|nr:hypothetical protein GCM10010339_74520 [Streptomyces alanosinicus]